jgi:hypothetical protein
MTLKMIPCVTLILVLSCSQPTKATEIEEPKIEKLTTKDEAQTLNHKYNCDVSILDNRTKMNNTYEKEYLFGLAFLWKFYANVINQDRADSKLYFNHLMTSLQENKISKAKSACDSLINGCQKNIDLISNKKKGDEFEHFEKLLHCYYQTALGNYKMYQNILLESSTTTKKYEKVYDLLQSSMDTDDQKWNEVYEEYDILPKKYGFDKLK